jgi:hypothetical protein
VELVFNLIWAAVIATLWALWAGDRRFRRDASLRPAAGFQIIALLMLSAILLPVISITDDLQAYHNPAEVQRTCDRNDRHASLGQSLHTLPVALALLALCARTLHLHTIALLTINEAMPRHQIAFGHTLWSRPPPSV